MSAHNANGNGRRADFDAIVVGGGHNGLTAAAYLARRPARVRARGARDRRRRVRDRGAVARPAPTPHEERIPIRGRDLDATGRVHPAVLLTYVGEVREAWLDARLGALEPVPRLEVTHVSADFRHVPARRDAEVVVRCALDGLGTTGVRTRETIETVGGALVVHAGATVVAAGEDGAPRPLTDPEREALAR